MHFSFTHYCATKNPSNILKEPLNPLNVAYKEIILCLRKYRSKQVI